MIDSHAHIYLEQFDEDLGEVMERSLEEGVSWILMPNIDHTSIDRMLEVELKYPTSTHAMMGLHPCSVDKNFERELYEVENWLGKRNFIAVGEIGTDLYWDKSKFEYQKEALRIQCDLALKHELPVVLHCRESIDETIEIIQPFADKGLKGVFHCFTGDVTQGKKITEMGFFLGIGGVATFKNGGLDKVLPELPLDQMLLETDSPYLGPAPNRGKRNEPAYVSLIAEKIATILENDLEEVKETTTINTRKLFNF
jgi:TatD DNase family protein